jgi:hypothetical protein
MTIETIALIALIIPLVAGWTAAWLHWFFEGDLRHALFAFVFPEAWRADRAKEDIATLDREEFEMFLAAESAAPPFVRGVLGCPGCFSAYVSASGTALGIASFFFPIFLVPLVWATAAWVGHRLFHRI